MKKNTITVKQLMKRYALYGMISSALLLGSCESDKIKVNEYDSVETTMVETSQGKYKIESEKKVKDSVSRVLVRKLDGTVDTLNMDGVKKLYKDKDPLKGYEEGKSNQQYYNSHNNDMTAMWFLLYWSNYGYHLGRPYNYPVYSGVYRTPQAYQTAKATSRSVVSSRKPTTVSRGSTKAPVKSSSGYGKSSGRSSYGG